MEHNEKASTLQPEVSSKIIHYPFVIYTQKKKVRNKTVSISIGTMRGGRMSLVFRSTFSLKHFGNSGGLGSVLPKRNH